ncbi:uncharacterized protein [Henckelia pumila]|uniref:uncharacterized protein n=1 Tax=Henckelia pumila TaxID=405737 RepID=UPI003C6E5EED
MEIHVDLMDAHMYAFKRSVLQDSLNERENFQSLRRDVLPYPVRSQLRSEKLLDGVQSEENGNEVWFLLVAEIVADCGGNSLDSSFFSHLFRAEITFFFHA